MTAPVVPEDDPEFVRYQRESWIEWHSYVATRDIYVGNALSVRAGDWVAASNVERLGYLRNGLVREATDEEKGTPPEGLFDGDQAPNADDAARTAPSTDPTGQDTATTEAAATPARKTAAKSAAKGEE